jgi:hypothetical protein
MHPCICLHLFILHPTLLYSLCAIMSTTTLFLLCVSLALASFIVAIDSQEAASFPTIDPKEIAYSPRVTETYTEIHEQAPSVDSDDARVFKGHEHPLSIESPRQIMFNAEQKKAQYLVSIVPEHDKQRLIKAINAEIVRSANEGMWSFNMDYEFSGGILQTHELVAGTSLFLKDAYKGYEVSVWRSSMQREMDPLIDGRLAPRIVTVECVRIVVSWG